MADQKSQAKERQTEKDAAQGHREAEGTVTLEEGETAFVRYTDEHNGREGCVYDHHDVEHVIFDHLHDVIKCKSRRHDVI